MSYGKELTGSNLEKAADPYFIMKKETPRNDPIKLASVKIIMLVLLLVTPCAPRLTPPVLKRETEYNCESICALGNIM